jgi:hypothetical protein
MAEALLWVKVSSEGSAGGYSSLNDPARPNHFSSRGLTAFEAFSHLGRLTLISSKSSQLLAGPFDLEARSAMLPSDREGAEICPLTTGSEHPTSAQSRYMLASSAFGGGHAGVQCHRCCRGGVRRWNCITHRFWNWQLTDPARRIPL